MKIGEIPADGAKLKAYVDHEGFIKTELAKAFETSEANLYQKFKSKKFEPDTILSIEKVLNIKWKDMLNIEVKDNSVVNEKEATYRVTSLEKLYTLIDSNQTLADSNKTLAEANKELTLMLKSSTAGVPSQTDIDVAAKFSDLLEAVAEIASGKRYKSKPEALAALNKFVIGNHKSKKLEDIQDGSGK